MKFIIRILALIFLTINFTKQGKVSIVFKLARV